MNSNGKIKGVIKCFIGIELHEGEEDGYFIVINGTHLTEEKRRKVLIRICKKAGIRIADVDSGNVNVFEGHITEGCIHLDRQTHFNVSSHVSQFRWAEENKVFPLAQSESVHA